MKKFIYISLWIILGFLLSMLAHTGIEVWYINYLLSHNSAPVDFPIFGHYCSLPFSLALRSFSEAGVQYSLLLAGLVGGYFAGKFFWRVIYVERRR
jgi:hypothetical protein